MGREPETQQDAVIILEDGTLVRGTGFGHRGTAYGELVFNTGMTGYVEALTDPSYAGQILLFTYPLIGNYGVDPTEAESPRVWPRAVVVREHCTTPAHRNSRTTLDGFLQDEKIPGIAGIDTRSLTVKTREKGTLRAIVCNTDPDEAEIGRLRARLNEETHPAQANLVAEVSTKQTSWWPKGDYTGRLDMETHHVDPAEIPQKIQDARENGETVVAFYDFGMKWNILRSLCRDHHVILLPWDTPAATVRDWRVDGVFLSNGPGDPSHPAITSGPVATIRDLLSDHAIWGICFGHQLLALALGGSTYKLPYGHRGANLPVRQAHNHEVKITSQNHGYAVSGDGFDDPEVIITEVNNNDNTVEALAHKRLPIRSSQYHPEACPGPQDAGGLFEAFRGLITQKGTAAAATIHGE
jgi:carbamoyl-phosphate synthase small subunit